MTSYFDEHDCSPVNPEEVRFDILHLARVLATDAGNLELYNEFFGDNPPPPASKTFIENLPKEVITTEGNECPICLKDFFIDDDYLKLPCLHFYHPQCILPWLQRANSCPSCRREFPTDDPVYEAVRKEKKRQKDREKDLENLHSSMFG